jgi:single-strand DNA-binding protein
MCYQRLAEVCAQYLHTGSAVLVEGRLQMREWTSARGEKHQSLEIRAESVHFLEKAATATGAPDDVTSTEDPTS